MQELDTFLPEFQFSERHQLSIRAEPQRVDRALRDVRLAEIRVVRALFALRGLSRVAKARARLLDTRGGVLLADIPGEGLVLGLTGQFWRLRGGRDRRPRSREEFASYVRPDSCKAVVEFRVTPGPRGASLLSTETRVHVADAAARRRFRRYWWVVRPFSGLIRILVLRAAKRRAEAG